MCEEAGVRALPDRSAAKFAVDASMRTAAALILVAMSVCTMAVVAHGADTGSLAGFQSQHPTCSFITDGCTLCARDGDHLACSTAGIACQPGPLRCNGAEPEPAVPKADPAK